VTGDLLDRPNMDALLSEQCGGRRAPGHIRRRLRSTVHPTRPAPSPRGSIGRPFGWRSFESSTSSRQESGGQLLHRDRRGADDPNKLGKCSG
jgi:hypothetical protein